MPKRRRLLWAPRHSDDVHNYYASQMDTIGVSLVADAQWTDNCPTDCHPLMPCTIQSPTCDGSKLGIVVLVGDNPKPLGAYVDRLAMNDNVDLVVVTPGNHETEWWKTMDYRNVADWGGRVMDWSESNALTARMLNMLPVEDRFTTPKAHILVESGLVIGEDTPRPFVLYASPLAPSSGRSDGAYAAFYTDDTSLLQTTASMVPTRAALQDRFDLAHPYDLQYLIATHVPPRRMSPLYQCGEQFHQRYDALRLACIKADPTAIVHGHLHNGGGKVFYHADIPVLNCAVFRAKKGTRELIDDPSLVCTTRDKDICLSVPRPMHQLRFSGERGLNGYRMESRTTSCNSCALFPDEYDCSTKWVYL